MVGNEVANCMLMSWINGWGCIVTKWQGNEIAMKLAHRNAKAALSGVRIPFSPGFTGQKKINPYCKQLQKIIKSAQQCSIKIT